jgi:hypothetical protein
MLFIGLSLLCVFVTTFDSTSVALTLNSSKESKWKDAEDAEDHFSEWVSAVLSGQRWEMGSPFTFCLAVLLHSLERNPTRNSEVRISILAFKI